jgi:glucose/mannose-6-phosphate isomerase
VTQPHYLDTLGMWDATAGMPEQVSAAMTASAEVLQSASLPAGNTIRSVVVFGMGNAALAGDVTAAYCADHASLPVTVCRGYEAPSFVGPETLALAVSFTGDTAETVAATTSAQERGAPVVVVAGGGALAELAASSDLPCFALPPSVPASRAALGAMVPPILLTLAHLGVVPNVAPLLEAAVATIGRRRDGLLAPHNEAEEVARLIGRTIPLVYGSTGIAAAAAGRWKSQVNENAKTPAFAGVVPEVGHNEIAGWGQHGDITRQVLTLITLRHGGEHPGVAGAFASVVEATDEVMASIIPVWGGGEDDLTRFFDLALFGDFVSLHMAGREDIDPGPVPALVDAETQ